VRARGPFVRQDAPTLEWGPGQARFPPPVGRGADERGWGILLPGLARL